MKHHLFFIILCLAIATSVRGQELKVQEKTCDELKLECENLEASISKSTSNAKKKEIYNKMLFYLRQAKEMHCTGKEGDKIKKIKEELSKLSSQKEKEDIPTEITIKSDDDSVRIDLKHRKSVRILDLPNWLIPQETGDENFIEFSAERNLSPHNRQGILELEVGKKHHQITIVQKAAPLQANVTEHIGFGQNGGPAIVYIETNDTAWDISCKESWITTELRSYGAKVICTENPTKKRRSAKIKVRFACGETRNVEVNQAIGKTTLSVPQKDYAFDYNGGKNETVSVVCNYDQWSASCSDEWIKVRKKYGGIAIECEPNRIASTRTAIVKIETSDEDHLIEYIRVSQSDAPAYLSAEQDTYNSDGYERTINVNVKSNIPNWHATVDNGNAWTSVKAYDSYIRVYLNRNDWNSSRTSKVRLYGKGESYTISFIQPNRGYHGRYKDYFDAKGGNWHVTWLSMDFHALTTVGNNISLMNARWKPVEISLLNFNMDYLLENMFSFNWEPVIRGFVPISRDGKWAAYAGMGGHVCMTDGFNYFLLELGTEVQWNKKHSSRIFFKYNGGCSLGMSFDFGKWFK